MPLLIWLKGLFAGGQVLGFVLAILKWLITTRAGRFTALVMAVVIAFLWYGHSQKREGRDEVRTEINQQNKESVGNANSFRRTRMECVARGGVFDFAKGTCDR